MILSCQEAHAFGEIQSENMCILQICRYFMLDLNLYPMCAIHQKPCIDKPKHVIFLLHKETLKQGITSLPEAGV
jgi:hypothetical protein